MFSFLKKSLSSTTDGNHNTSKNKEEDDPGVETALEAIHEQELTRWKETVYDIIRAIRDPEKPESLEELCVVREELVSVRFLSPDRPTKSSFVVRVGIVPTIPHCSLATLIGLCLRVKLERELPPKRFKVDLYLLEGTHQADEEVTKQINDKERVAAAMENPHLRKTVEECIGDEE